MVGLGGDPKNSYWIDGQSPQARREKKEDKKQDGICDCCFRGESDNGENIKPQMLISIEVLPKEIADKYYPAGEGRNDPNTNPVLPPPKGRIAIGQLWNPCYVISAFCGDELARELGCFFCCLVFLAVMIYLGPLILDTGILFLELPPDIGLVIVIAFVIIIACTIYQVYTMLHGTCCPSKQSNYEEISDEED